MFRLSLVCFLLLLPAELCARDINLDELYFKKDSLRAQHLAIQKLDVYQSVQAHLVDRAALAEHQERNDAVMALATLKTAFVTDVSPILAMARHRAGGAIDPIATYRASGYRARVAGERPQGAGRGAGIVG